MKRRFVLTALACSPAALLVTPVAADAPKSEDVLLIERRESPWRPFDTAPVGGPDILMSDGDYVSVGTWYEATSGGLWLGAGYASLWMPIPALPGNV